jgi:hypothetical protein
VQSAKESAVVDLMITFDQDASADRWTKRRFNLSAFSASESLHRKSQTDLETKDLFEGLVIVSVPRRHKRPAAAVADRAPARFLELLDEVWIHATRFQVELKQSFLTVMDLSNGGQHPGRGPRCAPTWGLVDHGHAMTLLR